MYPGVGACLQADARQKELTPVPESERNGSYLTCKARKGTRFRMAGDQEPHPDERSFAQLSISS